MSDSSITPAIQLNTRGLRCPEPVMMLHQAIRKSKSGDVVEIFATDNSTSWDIPKFCMHLGHELLLQEEVLDAAGNRHDMDTLAEKYLGHQTIKFSDVAGKGKGQITFNQVSIDKAAEYSAEDADITLRLHQALYPRVEAEPALKRVYEEIEMPLVPVLATMEQAGVKLDVPLLRKISAELAQKMDELQAAAFVEAGSEFNLGSPKQLQTILFEKLQLPVLGKTPKGEPSTAEDVLEELAALESSNIHAMIESDERVSEVLRNMAKAA